MKTKEHCIIRYTDLNFDYIGIPKNGSSSFKTSVWLEQKIISESDINWDIDWYKKYKKYLTYISPAQNKLPTVIHFRDPVKRLISTFKDITQGKKQNIVVNGIASNGIKNLDYFVDLINDMSEEDRNVHLRSQSWFVKHIDDFKNCILFTTENFEQGLNKVNQTLNLTLQLYRFNTTDNITTPAINQQTISKIEQYYATGFDLWENSKR